MGAIDIYDNFTFVEVTQAVAERVIDALQSATLHGKSFTVDIARPREEHEQAAPRPAASGGKPQPQPTRNSGQPARESRPPAPSGNGIEPDLDDEEDDDFEPPSRPPNWRDDVRPRAAYGMGGQAGQRPPRPAGGRGREGFGPFRGPEPRESPPWQRRRSGGDRGGFGAPHSGEGGFRPQRGEGPPPPRGANQGPRPQDQANRRPGREGDGRRQRRRDFPPGESGRRPANLPGNQRPRPPREEGDE